MTPRYLKLVTHSTVSPLITVKSGGFDFLLKSMHMTDQLWWQGPEQIKQLFEVLLQLLHSYIFWPGSSSSLCAHLYVLQVYFDQADFLGLRQQLDACDACKLCEVGEDAQFVVYHLTHSIACSYQKSHHRLSVLELQTKRGVMKQVELEKRSDENQKLKMSHKYTVRYLTIIVALKDFPPNDLRSLSSSR